MTAKTRNTGTEEQTASTDAIPTPTLLTSAGVQRARRGGELPQWALDAYNTSNEDGQPYSFEADTEEIGKGYVKWLRAAAQHFDGGLAVSNTYDEENQVWMVDFQAKPRKQRTYTVADIRAWAAENIDGFPDALGDKITQDIRDAFKAARKQD